MYYIYEFGDFKFSYKKDNTPQNISGTAEHFHTNYELLLHLEGSVIYNIENIKYKLEPFDVLLIRPGEHHHIEQVENEVYSRRVIRFPKHFIPPEVLRDLKNKDVKLNIKDKRVYESLTKLDEFVDIYHDKSNLTKLSILLKNSLLEFIVLYSDLENKEGEVQNTGDDLVNDVLTYINDNISKPIRIDDICLKFYISKSKLYRTFQENMQIPVAQYIRNKRVMLAHNLIENGQNPSDVYELCGFEYYSTFFRTYKKIFGKSPSKKYVNQLNQNAINN